MAKINYDGVLESAHFNSDGQVDWVVVYMRRGPIFTDRVILDRQSFVDQLKGGKRYMLGERILNLGGTFKVTQPVRLVHKHGSDLLLVGDGSSAQQELAGVPVQ